MKKEPVQHFVIFYFIFNFNGYSSIHISYIIKETIFNITSNEHLLDLYSRKNWLKLEIMCSIFINLIICDIHLLSA